MTGGTRVKHLIKHFAQTGLAAGLLAASLLASAPSRAEPAPAAQAPAPISQASETKTRIAWDRVGSPERMFG